MNYVIASVTKQSIFLTFSILLALLAACGDESSSSAPDPIGEISSSSNDDNGSSGKDKDASSSSQKDSKKSCSSAAEKNSSSSVSGKNSSSSVVESSSSEGCPFNGRNEDGSPDFAGACCDGDTAILMSGKYTQYFTCKYNVWLRDSIGGQDTIKPYVPHPNMEKQFASKIDYETFVDERDGQEYKIVTIKKHFDGAGDGVDEQYTFFCRKSEFGKTDMG